MKLKFCSWRMCKYGRNRHGNPKMITNMKRAGRHSVKILLKKGEYENLPDKIGIPYLY